MSRLIMLSGLDFWTILVLAPASKPGYLEQFKLPPSSPSAFVLDLVAWALEDATDSWSKIEIHLQKMIGYSILDPRKHDKLLYDDEGFTRSRRYFRSANSLQVFLQDSSRGDDTAMGPLLRGKGRHVRDV
jgi:hypothetical protein